MAATRPATRSSDGLLAASLTINEIFFSLQGETSRAGLPTVFVRLTGCPLRCTYCDTEYAFHAGEKMPLGDILQAVGNHRTRYVTVTGGEPLAQKNCLALLELLCNEGYDVSLETGGAMDIAGVDPRVARILDLKTPASGESHRNRYANLEHLNAQDQVKFVICDREDYEWAREQLNQYRLHERCEVLFSPSHEQLTPNQLADWVLEDNLPVRFQVQLHKYLWGDVPGR